MMMTMTMMTGLCHKNCIFSFIYSVSFWHSDCVTNVSIETKYTMS